MENSEILATRRLFQLDNFAFEKQGLILWESLDLNFPKFLFSLRLITNFRSTVVFEYGIESLLLRLRSGLLHSFTAKRLFVKEKQCYYKENGEKPSFNLYFLVPESVDTS